MHFTHTHTHIHLADFIGWDRNRIDLSPHRDEEEQELAEAGLEDGRHHRPKGVDFFWWVDEFEWMDWTDRGLSVLVVGDGIELDGKRLGLW